MVEVSPKSKMCWETSSREMCVLTPRAPGKSSNEALEESSYECVVCLCVYSDEEKHSEIPGKKCAGTAFLHLSKLEQERKICDYTASDRLGVRGETLVFSFCCSSFPRLVKTLASATLLTAVMKYLVQSS